MTELLELLRARHAAQLEARAAEARRARRYRDLAARIRQRGTDDSPTEPSAA